MEAACPPTHSGSEGIIQQAWDALSKNFPIIGSNTGAGQVGRAGSAVAAGTAKSLTGDVGKTAQWILGGIGNVLFVVIGLLLIGAAIFYFAASNKTVQEVVKKGAALAA